MSICGATFRSAKCWGGSPLPGPEEGNAGGGHHFRWKCDAHPGPHPSATEGPHNDPCTPDFEDFARWDGVWARMAAYFGDAVLIALWLR